MYNTIKLSPYKRLLKEDVSETDLDYLKTSVSGYLYSKDKKVLHDAVDFISQFGFGKNPITKDEAYDTVEELIKTMPKPQAQFRKNKKEFTSLFYAIKDSVGADYEKLYDIYNNKRIKKNKVEIKRYYELANEMFISLNYLKDTYLKWYKEIESGGSIVAKVSGYIIPEKIGKMCNITDSLKDIDSWKCKVVLANNGGKKGQWDDVGYLGISKNSVMIPIARSDEHQAGYEYLYALQKKGIVKDVDNFITIFKSYTKKYTHYFHLGYEPTKEYQKLLDNRILCLKLWLKKTGIEIECNSTARQWKGTATQFIKEFEGLSIADAFIVDSVETPKKVIKKKVKLAPKGEKVVAYIKEIWERLKKGNDLVFNSTYVLLSILKPYLDRNTYMGFYEQAVQAEGKEDFSIIEKLVFSFDGIKNTIHIRLKKKDKELKPLFGSLALAKKEFDKLGALK